MSGPVAIQPLAAPESGSVDDVRRLVAEAAAYDGFTALNEAADLHLRHPRPGVRHLLAYAGAELVGYAQLDQGADPDTLRQAQGADPDTLRHAQGVDPDTLRQAQGADPDTLRQAQGAETGRHATGQLVVAPEARRRGVGEALLRQLLALAEGPLDLWAMHDTDAARALAERAGLHRGRELVIMTRSLADPLPAPPLPREVSIRSFRVGADEEAWLAVNARAFAGHPEQGRIDAEDLAERMAEPWFEPAGFLLAERDGGLIGFHWTKQHPGRLGEVYVLGVDPDAGGRGLGKALLLSGLRHLRDRGNTRVQLYVEGKHARAIALYARAGFVVGSRDVMYSSST